MDVQIAFCSKKEATYCVTLFRETNIRELVSECTKELKSIGIYLTGYIVKLQGTKVIVKFVNWSFNRKYPFIKQLIVDKLCILSM